MTNHYSMIQSAIFNGADLSSNPVCLPVSIVSNVLNISESLVRQKVKGGEFKFVNLPGEKMISAASLAPRFAWNQACAVRIMDQALKSKIIHDNARIDSQSVGNALGVSCDDRPTLAPAQLCGQVCRVLDPCLAAHCVAISPLFARKSGQISKAARRAISEQGHMLPTCISSIKKAENPENMAFFQSRVLRLMALGDNHIFEGEVHFARDEFPSIAMELRLNFEKLSIRFEIMGYRLREVVVDPVEAPPEDTMPLPLFLVRHYLIFFSSIESEERKCMRLIIRRHLDKHCNFALTAEIVSFTWQDCDSGYNVTRIRSMEEPLEHVIRR